MQAARRDDERLNAMDLAAILPRERDRLVRLCAKLTGDAAAAEDLAQETLLAAWRQVDTLRNPDAT